MNAFNSSCAAALLYAVAMAAGALAALITMDGTTGTDPHTTTDAAGQVAETQPGSIDEVRYPR